METTTMEVKNMKISDFYNYTKSTVTKTDIEKSVEYKLTTNNFDPEKFSPNLFLTKLEFRMKHYHLAQKLNDDALEL
tara:strand:- start:174 stop:404 length:231 start_codon:yes stop_codon:yes gene_type:complete